jgi:hypothetical protein
VVEGRRAFLVPNPLFPSSPPPVSGRGDIATQFAALRALFSNVDIAAQAPSVDAPTRGDAGGGRVVSVDATQTYSLPLLFAPSIAIAVTTTLHVTPDGVITRHTDAWRSVRVGSLPAARVLLQSPRALAAAVGRGSSKLLRVVGVGGGGVARRWRHSHAD